MSRNKDDSPLTCTILEALAARRVTQADLAIRIGMARSHMHEIVRGKRLPSLPRALQIAEVLRTPVELLWLRPGSQLPAKKSARNT